jgi:hypothetical protein
LPSQQSSAVGFRCERNSHKGTILLACVITLSTTLAMSDTPSQTATSDDASIVQDFEGRVSRYLEERRKQAGTPSKPTSSPEKLDHAQQALAQESQLARTEAQRGDIFSPAITTYFRRQIAGALTGPQGVKVRASLRHAEPVQDVPLHVNEVYPDRTPLQSTPPTLLLKLPALPKELQYRIVGRTLVLLDVAPKLIVDFIPDAIFSNKD